MSLYKTWKILWKWSRGKGFEEYSVLTPKDSHSPPSQRTTASSEQPQASPPPPRVINIFQTFISFPYLLTASACVIITLFAYYFNQNIYFIDFSCYQFHRTPQNHPKELQLEGVEKHLKLENEDGEASRSTLYRYGNTSSSSVWYELRYLEAKGRMKKGDRVWQIGFGSGFNSKERYAWSDRIDLYPVCRDGCTATLELTHVL
ncbi:hypothetical protein F2Q68_00046255 [Brassica cretica]|uniref:Beta-ketoacyl-[acyl-carrier-protein] synthase III C-terminal domain-containing protein n=1 Tax=Brassica cretica TaxID=69181 RepID=A0A8S9LT62_BRACR|nr:hypothetical protein F2Q68_00046255 [Brassica cretica]